MQTREQSVLRGSVWLMGSALLAKMLGAVFRIPLTALLGGTGMGYYSCAYGLFLPVFALSVTGMNTAVAALTAGALAKGNRADAARIAAAARRMFGLGGTAGSLLLFLSADALCGTLLQNSRAALAVKLFSPAVCICCVNAVLRGLHEGCRRMTPTAVSQVTEGIGRVIFGLLLCRLVFAFPEPVLRLLPRGTSLTEAAAAAAIFGVTLSTLLGTLTLLCFDTKRRADPVPQYPADPDADRRIRRALLQVLLPVAAASLVTNLTTLIDLAAGLRVLSAAMLRDPLRFGLPASLSAEAASEAANFSYGAYSGLAVTVFNLVPSVTNMLGKGVLPAFAGSYARGDRAAMRRHAETVLRRTAFLAVPAGLSVSALSEPILRLLFAARGAEIAAAAAPLRWLGIAVLFAAPAYPLFSMLQAAGFAGDTVTVMLCGAGVKLLGNLLLIPRMGLSGAALSTLLCYLLILLLARRCFTRRTETALPLLRCFLRPGLCGLLCACTAQYICGALSAAYPGRRFLPVMAAAAAGGSLYLLSFLLTLSPARRKDLRNSEES